MLTCGKVDCVCLYSLCPWAWLILPTVDIDFVMCELSVIKSHGKKVMVFLPHCLELWKSRAKYLAFLDSLFLFLSLQHSIFGDWISKIEFSWICPTHLICHLSFWMEGWYGCGVWSTTESGKRSVDVEQRKGGLF